MQIKKIVAGIIVVAVLAGAYYFFNPPSSPDGNLVYSFDCSPIQLEYREYLSVNTFEGSGARYSFLYKRNGDASIDIPVTYRGFAEEAPSEGYVQSLDLLKNLSFPFKSFGTVPDTELPAYLILVDPAIFSKSEFEDIANCINKNKNDLYSAYEKYVADSESRNHRLNLYSTVNQSALPGIVGTTIQFAGVGYVSQEGFLNYSNEAYRRVHSAQ